MSLPKMAHSSSSVGTVKAAAMLLRAASLPSQLSSLPFFGFFFFRSCGRRAVALAAGRPPSCPAQTDCRLEPRRQPQKTPGLPHEAPEHTQKKNAITATHKHISKATDNTCKDVVEHIVDAGHQVCYEFFLRPLTKRLCN